MKRVFNVIDLSFGDSGKGSKVDYLVRKHGADLVVRYCGGAQAAHNVVTPDGRHHTFSQLGSGSFAGARTHLSKYMLVNPTTFVNELDVFLKVMPDFNAKRMVTVDENALVTTPFHVALGRLRELSRGRQCHGSCGMGIGETVSHAGASGIRVCDLAGRSEERVKDLLADLQMALRAEAEPLLRLARETEQARTEFNFLRDSRAVEMAVEKTLRFLLNVDVVDETWLSDELRRSSDSVAVFEGSQGMLIDETVGFAPHVTWSDVTDRNFWRVVNEAKSGRGPCEVTTVGVMRAFMTRHGDGPFPTENVSARAAILPSVLASEHNVFNDWQKGFRYGHLDLPLLRYAADRVAGLDRSGSLGPNFLAVTWLDAVSDFVEVNRYYSNFELPSAVEHKPTWENQMELSRRLSKAEPSYQRVHATQLLDVIEQGVGRKVKLLSYGPKALDCVGRG